MNYLIKFDENGKRSETHVVEEKTEQQVQEMLDKGFVLVPEEDYQLLIGNVDDKEYIRNPETGAYEQYVPPEPTQEEIEAQIQKSLTQAVQHVLDSKAQELNYDSCLSVCSYIDTGVQKFDDEGKAFRAWRSQVWAKGYEILAEVQEGKREIPTEEELIAELPELTIVYEETDTPKSSLDYLNSLGQ